MFMFRSFLARDDCYAFMESNLQKYRSVTMIRRDSLWKRKINKLDIFLFQEINRGERKED